METNDTLPPPPVGISQRHLFDVLSGRVFADEKPVSRTIRLFISSNPIDSVEERNALMSTVFPQLKHFCHQHGYHLHMIDLYWNKEVLKEEYSIAYDPRHLKKSMHEIKLCQELSVGPSFMMLLSHRYCPRKLPFSILKEDFQLIYPMIDDHTAKKLILEWYILDNNANPPEYILQSPMKKFALYGNTNKEAMLQQWNEWLSIAHSMESSIRKAAKYALGKDKVKVQVYLNSVLEDEIVQGVFHSPGDPNKHCLWFKRVFTNLYAVNKKDPARHVYLDTVWETGELDNDAQKNLNHLKETRMTAKYIGLDPRSIYDFPIKWIKGLGLDVAGDEMHNAYIVELCNTTLATLKSKITEVMTPTTSALKLLDGLYQEIVWHTHYATSKLEDFYERKEISSKIVEYVNGYEEKPLALYGNSGSGKTYVMAHAACMLKEKFNLQNACIVVRFLGTSHHSSCIRLLLRSVCQQIAVVYRLGTKPPNQYHSLVQYFAKLLTLPSQERPLFLLFDAIDQLSEEDGPAGLSWLPAKISKHVKIILSALQDPQFRVYPVLCSMYGSSSSNLVEIPYLKPDESKRFLEHCLSIQNRCLAPSQWNTFTNQIKTVTSLLFVKLLSLKACNWKSFSQVEFSEESVAAMVEGLFGDLEERVGYTLVSHSLGYITAAKSGLSEMELMDLLVCDEKVCTEVFNSPSLNGLRYIPAHLWSEILYSLRHLLEFRITDGTVLHLCWAHRVFGLVATKRYVLPNKELIYKGLCDYFSGQLANIHNDSHSNVDQSNEADVTMCQEHINAQPLLLNEECYIYNHRKINELPYCLTKSDRLSELQDLICDWNWMMSKNKAMSCEDYVADFAPLVPTVSESTTATMAELRLIKEAFTHSSEALANNSNALPSQLIGRLYPFLMDPLMSRPLIGDIVRQCFYSSPLFVPLTPTIKLPGGPLLTTLKGHRDSVTSLCLQAFKQGKARSLSLVSGSMDKSLKTWELENGSVLKTLDGHTKGVTCIAVSSDAPYVASGSADCTIKFWHLHSGELIYTMTGHMKGVSAVSVASMGDKTVSGSYDSTIKIWNTDVNSSCAAELIFTLSGHQATVTSLCLAANDKHLVTGDKNGRMVVWDIVSCESLHRLNLHTKSISSMALTKTWPYYIASCSKDNSIRIWTIDNGKCVQVMYYTDSSTLTSLSVCDDGKILTGTDNGTVIVWNVHNGEIDYKLYGHSAPVQCISALKNGCLAVSCSTDCTICVWDLVIKPFSPTPLSHTGSVNSIVSSTDFYLSTGADCKTLVWDCATNDIGQEFQHEHEVKNLVSCQDFSTFFMACSNGSIMLYDSKSHKTLTLLTGHRAQVNSIAVSKQEEFLISGAQDCLAIIWCLNEFKKLKTLRKHKVSVTAVCFAQTHKYYLAITASHDGLLVIQDLNQPENCLQFKEHQDSITSLQTSDDNTILLTGSADHTIKLWCLPSGTVSHTLVGHTAAVTSIVCLSNNMVISASLDKTVCAWDTDSKSCIASYYADEAVTTLSVLQHATDIFVYFGTANGNILVLNLMINIDDPPALFDKLKSNVHSVDSQPEFTKAVSYDAAPMDTILEENASECSHSHKCSTENLETAEISDILSVASNTGEFAVDKKSDSDDNQTEHEDDPKELQSDVTKTAKSSVCAIV
ncbi:NACHT domain- and WD repeat-containing protein 1-like isoform X2 [Dysidea avara]|uniref:NACHT domain- and WD repeat-containing protein 1-like isoform X2 n=1 Tax=Dysidea avara TaxID=196820 RepID=UPI00331F03A2